jgi:hypothetical protein
MWAEKLISEFPEQRTNRWPHQPSDLINILFLGNRDEINRAFRAAGWSGAQARSILSIYKILHCMAERAGYSTAPMGRLTLNGLAPDAEFQKGLDTFSKRHHLRLWHQPKSDAWLSAATEDVGYKVSHLHLTHATDPEIDNERNKILDDLAFTGCVDSAEEIARDLHYGPRRRERLIETDGKIVVLRFNSCKEPRNMPGVDSAGQMANARRRAGQAWTAFRNDLLRSNPVTVGYQTARLISSQLGAQSAIRQAGLRSFLHAVPPPHWSRPSVLDANSMQVEMVPVSNAPASYDSAGCSFACVGQGGKK